MCFRNGSLRGFTISIGAGEIVQDCETASVLVQFENGPQVVTATKGRYAIEYAIRALQNWRRQIPHIFLVGVELMEQPVTGPILVNSENSTAVVLHAGPSQKSSSVESAVACLDRRRAWTRSQSFGEAKRAQALIVCLSHR